MDALKELHSVSEFEPRRGDLLRLFEMVVDIPDFNRAAAEAAFLEENKSRTQFRTTYKRLKDRLVDGFFVRSFASYEQVQRAHLRIWKSYAATKSLIGLNKKKAGISIAEETFKAARKYGLIEVALSISRELELHYSTVEPSKKRHKNFRELKESLLLRLVEEVKAEGVLLDLISRINTGEATKGFALKIKEVENDLNHDFRFNLYVFTSKALLHTIRGYSNQLLETCQEALAFFESIKTPLLPIIRWNFLTRATPVLIGNGDYATAQLYSKLCVEKLAKKGGFNWHLSLLHTAIVGFHSGKPAIALEAWKTSKRHLDKFESAMVAERWKIIEAHLHIYAKLSVIKMPTKFRLGKFLNEMLESSKRKAGQNVSIMIVQLVHLLLDDKKERFMMKSERIDKYVHTHLSSEKYARSRNFLKMLKQVELGDYQKDRVVERTKKYFAELKRTEIAIGVDLLENEVVRYEVIWGEMLKILK